MTELASHPSFWHLAIFAAILLANLWVFWRREWEANHRPADYAQLNYPTDRPTLRRWKISGLHFRPEIVWNRRPSHWQVIRDGKVVATVPGDAPEITLDPAFFMGGAGETLPDFSQRHTLRPLPAGLGPDLNFDLTPIAKEFYRQRGMHFPEDLFLTSSDIPAGTFTRHAVASWVDDYRYIGAPALAETDRMIREEMKITDYDGDLERMAKIIHFIRTRLTDASGVPKNDFRWKNPFQIFGEMCAGTGKGWCTQNAQIFTFFANRAGVATRFVYCGTVQDNQVIYDGHSWTESYLKDQNRWIYSDPLEAIVGVFDRRGRALNTADVFQLCQYEAFEGTTARVFKDWHWRDLPVEANPDAAVDVPFELVNKTAKKQFTPHTIIKYRKPPNIEDVRDRYGMLFTSWTFAWSNFCRYLSRADLAYANFPTEGDRVYRTRQFLFGALVGSLISLGLNVL